jgi:hypothetical protein
VDAGFVSEKTGMTMAKTNFKSVDEYIASQPDTAKGALDAKGALERVQGTIRTAIPVSLTL